MQLTIGDLLGPGRAFTRLTGPDGRTAQLWVDRQHPYIEVLTGDTLAPHRRRRGLGCESISTQWGAVLL